MEKPILQDSPSFVDLCTLHQHAMRYYRLWIYACNTVLALATLVFTVFAVSVLVDPRISLLSGVELYQPTFLYAYVALLLQCGVLQAIGCIGALRLNQRLLNTYWSLLLVLMIGDILVGLVWAFRLDQIKSNLRPMLKNKLVTLYHKDKDFTEVWDWVQTNDECCGVDGPNDYQLFNRSSFGRIDISELTNETWESYTHQQGRIHHNQQQSILILPNTCCVFTDTPVTTTIEPPSSSEVPGVGDGYRRQSHHRNRLGGSGNKGDRLNDVMSTKPGGYYYQPPQQLKGSFQNSYMNNEYPENFIETYINSSSSNNNNLIVSNLRQYPMTDQVYAAGMSSFGPGALLPQVPHTIRSPHDRRKLKSKHLDEYGYGDKNARTPIPTMESAPSRKPSTTIGGVCHPPTHLRENSSPNSFNSNSNSHESNSASVEDSTEINSSTTSTPSSSPPPVSSTTTESYQYTSPTTEPLFAPSSTFVPPFARSNFKTSSNNNHRHHHHTLFFSKQHGEGCGDKVLKWVEHSSDILFVIGFCIIVFLKGCFIAILRYEIKEMIEKIKLLNGEDAGRTAAMNELIGLTSMYESGNEDSGEREGLMSGVHNNNQDTSNTNIDTIDGENGSGRNTIHSGTDGSGGRDNRKDSINFVKENHLIGNHVGGNRPPSRYIGNHVASSAPATINDPSSHDDYPRMLAVAKENVLSGTNKHDIEEDFDSGSALLGSKQCTSDSPPTKNFLNFQHRNENGGRNLPKNGNNNSSHPTSSTTIENAPVGVPTSASAPVPIDAIARVTNASIH